MHLVPSKQLHQREPEGLWGNTGWVYPAVMPQDYSTAEDCSPKAQGWRSGLPTTYFCGREQVTQQDIGDEDGNGDDNRQCCPQIDAHSIQVPDGSQFLQLFSSAGTYPAAEVLLPGVKLDHTDAR